MFLKGQFRDASAPTSGDIFEMAIPFASIVSVRRECTTGRDIALVRYKTGNKVTAKTSLARGLKRGEEEAKVTVTDEIAEVEFIPGYETLTILLPSSL